MKNASSSPLKKNGQRSIKKNSIRKRQEVPALMNQNLEKMEDHLKREIGIAPIEDSCQLIQLAQGFIGAVEQRPEIYRDSTREARELRTVLFHLRKAHEKLSALVPTTQKPEKSSYNKRLLKVV